MAARIHLWALLGTVTSLRRSIVLNGASLAVGRVQLVFIGVILLASLVGQDVLIVFFVDFFHD